MVKNLPANVGDLSSIPGLGRSPQEENGNPLQYSCLGIPSTEEPGGLQSMGSQKSQTGLSGKEQQLLIYSVVLVLSVHQNESFKKKFFN